MLTLFTILSCLALYCSLAAAATNTTKSSKRGLTYPSTNNPQDVLNINQTHSLISWVYDWGLIEPPYLAASSLEYIPMQWGSGNIENLASALTNQSAKIVLVNIHWLVSS